MVKIKDLDIYTGTKNVLIKAGFEYLEDLSKTTMHKLAQLKGFGIKSIHTITKQMKLHNLPEIELGEPIK